ncbi:hypothetical protein [Rhodococcus opacus]|uniref:hypothetical protein n=1 Tax=Rhodococcus opacus TaxID=37919 RepID=UPI001C483116|nr:hypothetical protein [Rhodococcus opacus]MBV6758387.1 hypothetical protein [Rhodococcus opacus]
MTSMISRSSHMVRHIVAHSQRQYWKDVGWLAEDLQPTAAEEWYADWIQPGEWFANDRGFKALATQVDRVLARHGIGNRDYWLNPMLPPAPDTLDAALDKAIAAFERGSGHVPRGLYVSARLAWRAHRGYRLRVTLPGPVDPAGTVPRLNYVRRYQAWQWIRHDVNGTFLPAWALRALALPNPFA